MNLLSYLFNIFIFFKLTNEENIYGFFYQKYEREVFTSLLENKKVLKLKSGNKFECALKCLKRNDCNMAVMNQEYCTLFVNCQNNLFLYENAKTVLFEKKVKCFKNYSSLKSNFILK